MMLHLSALVALVACCCLLMVSVEADGDAEQEYQRLFARKGKQGQLSETLQDLQNLADLLRDKQDEVSKERLAEIEKLVKFNDPFDNCDAKIARSLKNSIDKYDFPGKEVPSIRAYLKDRRDEMFAKCYPFVVEKMQTALNSFARKQSHPLIVRFQKFIAANTYPLPRLTFASDIERQLLNYIAKEYNERRLDPKMTKEEFEDRFNKTLKQACEDTREEIKFVYDYDIFFLSRRMSAKMDSRLKDMYRMRTICSDFFAHSEELPQVLYEKLTR